LSDKTTSNANAVSCSYYYYFFPSIGSHIILAHIHFVTIGYL
jgi:hypothetical protein